MTLDVPRRPPGLDEFNQRHRHLDHPRPDRVYEANEVYVDPALAIGALVVRRRPA